MNFFRSAVSEGGDVSHKRLISLVMTASLFIGSMVVYFKYPNLIDSTYKTTCLFVLVMSGVATVAQIVALVKGGPTAPDNSITTNTNVSANQAETNENKQP